MEMNLSKGVRGDISVLDHFSLFIVWSSDKIVSFECCGAALADCDSYLLDRMVCHVSSGKNSGQVRVLKHINDDVVVAVDGDAGFLCLSAVRILADLDEDSVNGLL